MARNVLIGGSIGFIIGGVGMLFMYDSLGITWVALGIGGLWTALDA